MGTDAAAFEREAASYLGVPHAVSCASGTDAMILALTALDIRPGDEVVTTPFSFFAAAECIARAGAKPVFADVRPDTYNISMEHVKHAVTDRTRAFIPAHLFGQLCRMEEIEDFLAQRGIALVEDCAQAFGAHRTRGGEIIRAGAWGGIGCFSFRAMKTMKNPGVCWDAGMATAFSETHRDCLSKLRGMDAPLAAILRVRLKHVEERTEERRDAARRYKLLFAESGLLDFLTPPAEDEGNRHTYHRYVIRASRRDELRKYLDGRGITANVCCPPPLHPQPCLERAGYKKGSLPVFEKLCGEVLALPMFPELTAEEQERIVGEIGSFYKQ
jgi:dTDP-4-amino-4,6-dideoxygalactose transaminase